IVDKRMKSKKYDINSNWSEIMDETFGSIENIKDESERKSEILARIEKLKALEIMSKCKISALVGEAGTGKTSIIKLLLSSEEIRNGEILLLAPTGKARVRLEEINKELNLTARTVAQFLSKSKRFDWKTLKYKMLGKTEEKSYGTVII